LINAVDEARPWFRRLLAVTVVVSVAFSYLGFASNYLTDQERRSAPLIARDDLKRQATNLAESISEGRRIAGSIYQNRVEYAQTVVSKVRHKQAMGAYGDPAEADATIAEWQTQIDQARDAQNQWAAFEFDPSEALGKDNVNDGFKVLQDAHIQLGRLIGMLRKDESKLYDMPPPPMPSPKLAESAQAKTALDLALGLLPTLPGLGWLALAAILELVPILFANASAAQKEASRRVRETGEAPDSPAADLAIQPRTEADLPLAGQISGFHDQYRLSTQAGAWTNGEMMEQERELEEARRSFQDAVRYELHNAAIEKRGQAEIDRLRHFVEAADQLTSDRRYEHEASQEVLRRLARDCGYEEVLRLLTRQEEAKAAEQPAWES